MLFPYGTSPNDDQGRANFFFWGGGGTRPSWLAPGCLRFGTCLDVLHLDLNTQDLSGLESTAAALSGLVDSRSRSVICPDGFIVVRLYTPKTGLIFSRRLGSKMAPLFQNTQNAHQQNSLPSVLKNMGKKQWPKNKQMIIFAISLCVKQNSRDVGVIKFMTLATSFVLFTRSRLFTVFVARERSWCFEAVLPASRTAHIFQCKSVSYHTKIVFHKSQEFGQIEMQIDLVQWIRFLSWLSLLTGWGGFEQQSAPKYVCL